MSGDTEEGDRRTVRAALDRAHRREWGAVLAATVRIAGDLDLAEECVQEAYASALTSWTRRGVPHSPGAWLTTTARRKALDAHRRTATLQNKLPLLVESAEETAVNPGDSDAPAVLDDLLRLVFICCHPALGEEASVALTLRLVCGLTTAEIACAFLVPEPTVAARITRAKKKIATARIAYRIPATAELPDRLDAVLTVVHLVFTSGHAAPGTELLRGDLVERALGLGQSLRTLMPDEPEVAGLLGLMLLTDSRRKARCAVSGRAVLLEDQDRSLWDAEAIAHGLRLVEAALRTRRLGRFAAQAAIAACHARAASFAETDWEAVIGWYTVLDRVWPSPVVSLNRAVAVGMRDGPDVALAQVSALEADGRLVGYRYLPATKADLFRRLGRIDEAMAAYRQALALTDNQTEREFLLGRLDLLSQVDLLARMDQGVRLDRGVDPEIGS